MIDPLLYIKKSTYSSFIPYNQKIYLLYDAKYVNPPFFTDIIIQSNKITHEELKMIYNMTCVNGYIYFPKLYNSFFQSSFINSTSICHISFDFISTQLYCIQKKENTLYLFPKYRVIEFLIMGTQKGGTTGLALNIGKHPDIYIDLEKDPRKSEIHYFDLNWTKGISWYKHHFDYSKKVVGEKTPDLMYLDYTFPYIQSINPYIKIILILRNPIERAYSAWKMAKQFYHETKTFEEAIEEEEKRFQTENITFYTAGNQYLHRGLYYKQLQSILKWFPMQHILILISEHVKKDMITEYNKVYHFLNISSFKASYELEFVSSNKSSILPATYKRLISFYQKDVRALEKTIGIRTGWFKQKKISL